MRAAAALNCVSINKSVTVFGMILIMQQLMCQQATSVSCLKETNHHAGWLFGSSSKKKSKSKVNTAYVTPVEQAQQLKEGRAVDLAALLELKQLIHHSADSFFDTWVKDGNPCNFAKVQDLSVTCSTQPAMISLFCASACAAQLLSLSRFFLCQKSNRAWGHLVMQPHL